MRPLRDGAETIRDDRKRLQRAFGSGRTPEAGFMNLERALVCALRDHGCLAWGAIDLGSNASGDMMHFDCRATGIGWKLSLERQRTAGANHPCVKSTVASEAEELETPPTPSVRSPVVPFLGRTTLVVHVEYAADEDRSVLPQGSQFAEDRRRAGVRARPSRSLRSRAQDDRRAHQEQTIRAGQACGRLGPRRSCSSPRSWIGRISRRTA